MVVVTPRRAAPLVLSLLVFVGALRLAVRAAIPSWAASILVTGSFLAVLTALASIAGNVRQRHRRRGIWIPLLATCLYLPGLGTFGLVDPWETHYAEVAREMLERRDFVSPWWANEGWFMTKPVLLFWLEAASMALLGVHTGPNEILAFASDSLARPEWAIRMPSFLCALAGVYALYRGVARAAGERAGVLAAIVLLSMPGFAMLSHQALTDMPLVSGIAGSLGMLVFASSTPASRESSSVVIRIRQRSFVVHGGHLVASLYVALVVPQLVAIVASQVHVAGGVLAGSPHACALPGQPACREIPAAHPKLSSLVQLAIWLPIVGLTAARLLETRRAKNLAVIMAWLFAALATMSKGPAGLVIPTSAAAMVLLERRSLRPLSWMELVTGGLVTSSLVAPWYLAIYARHGRSFLDELVMRNMLGRTLDHLHDTNAGEDVGLTYFVKQLGYATFPWFGFVVAALLSFPAIARFGRRATAKSMLFVAFVVAFTLVSAMRTKFHHYVLVALPPAAALVGIFIDELWERRESRLSETRTSAMLLVAGATTALVGVDVASLPAHFAKLMTYRYSRLWPSEPWAAPAIGCFVIMLALAMLAVAAPAIRRRALVAVATLAFGFALFLLDVYWQHTGPLGGQRAVFEAYYRARANDPMRTELVAYQLNWKGENFYSGNDLAIFIQSGTPFRKYVEGRKRRDARILYAVTETTRTSALRAELGSLVAFDVLTDAASSPDFSLVRAVLGP